MMARNCWRASCQQSFIPNVDKPRTYSCFYCPKCKVFMDDRLALREIERKKAIAKDRLERASAATVRARKHREKKLSATT